MGFYEGNVKATYPYQLLGWSWPLEKTKNFFAIKGRYFQTI